MNMQLTRRQFFYTSSALLTLEAASAQASSSAVVTTLCGTGTRGMAANGDAAGSSNLDNPYGMQEAPDRSSLFFVDNGSNRVLRLEYKTKKIFLVAGTGVKGYAGDGGPARAAQLAQPHELRFDSNGNLFVVERDNYVVRRIDAETSIITTYAGVPTSRGFSGDGGPATKAQFNQPHGIAIDPTDNLYVCDVLNHRIRRVDAQTGTITTFAGNGQTGRAPDEGPLTATPLEGPRSIEVSRAGRIYVALREGNAVFELDGKSGRLKRIAGNGENGYAGDGGPAIAAKFGSLSPGGLTGPKGLCVSEDGAMMYVADCENHVVRKVDLRTGIITTAVGTGQRGDGPDGDPRKCALSRPHGVYLRNRVLYIGDSENHKIRSLIPA
jgi:DNA-binding beta-propeller fold protein YncE